MATPSGKNNPGATPTQFTSSPFASSAPMGHRSLSHKSPSVTKTPSASGHHQSYPSVSSAPQQQLPTPLAGAASVDDTPAVPLSSPSALLALGLGGITPSPNTASAAAAAAAAVNDDTLRGFGIGLSLGMGGPRDRDRDIEEERRKNLAEVMRLLRTRVAGRGVCREGLERLGRLEGMECMWQDDSLSIAGNLVDLEIEFWHGREYVKDVVLRYVTPEAAEGQVRRAATEVLRRTLLQPAEEQEQGFWKDPRPFHENLQRLARMDHLSQQVNCFEAIEGLFESLRRIQDAEQRGQSPWQYVCTGSLGRPRMHVTDRVGLSLQYWVEQRRVIEAEHATAAGRPMDVDGTDKTAAGAEDGDVDQGSRFWSLVIECEQGYPSLRVSKEWVGSPAVRTAEGTNADANADDAGAAGDGSINWAEPPPTLVKDANEMSESDGQPPNRRFVARLEPPVAVPVHAASEIYRRLGLDLPPDSRLNAYDGLLVPPGNALKRQRDRPMITFDDDDDGGKEVVKRHQYSLHAFEQVAGRTLTDLPFAHPRQLAAIIPILRQYAFLSSILRRIFPEGEVKTEKREPGPEQDSELDKDKENENVAWEDPPLPSYLSNTDPTVSKLNQFLANAQGGSRTTRTGAARTSSPATTAAVVEVEVSLRTPASSGPSVLVLFSDGRERDETITVRLDVERGARVTVSEVTGMWSSSKDRERRGGNDDDDDDDDEGGRLLRERLAQVFATCEDVGYLVEWVLRQRRRRRRRRRGGEELMAG